MRTLRCRSARPALAAALLFAAVLSLAPAPARAIPAFARQYGFGCSNCHSGFPRLNDFGHRFRRNGYRIPGKESEEKTVFETGVPPVAARAAAAFNVDQFRATPSATNVNGFQVGYLDLLAAGLLSQRIGFLVVYPPPIPEALGLAAQPGSLEMANVIFSEPFSTRWLNVRAGRFEPAYVAFSVKRQLSVSPREAYDFAFPGGPPLSLTQSGIELSGYGGKTEYYAGWISGSPTDRPTDIPADVYVRLTQVLGNGEGQTAGQRLGVAAWYGSARPEGEPGQPRRGYWRVGLDASLNLGHFNLALQGLLLNDAPELWGATGPVNSLAGFAELSWMPRNDWVAFARFDGVVLPAAIASDPVLRGGAGVRYYPIDNLAVHLEYSHATGQVLIAGQPRATQDFATLRLDWAF